MGKWISPRPDIGLTSQLPPSDLDQERRHHHHNFHMFICFDNWPDLVRIHQFDVTWKAKVIMVLEIGRQVR